MSDELSLFTYIEQENGGKKWLVMLHGTGADEHDLLPLVKFVAPTADVLSLRGNVQERGMNRFFARQSMGVFDQASIKQESGKLADFMQAWMEQRQVETENLTFLGYSNGANMILALLFRYPELVQQAVLLHPMLPFKPEKLELTNKRFLVSYGEQDQMIPATESQQVIETLNTFGAEVEEVVHLGGHEIRQEELERVKIFLQS